jgi:hypothetical protein
MIVILHETGYPFTAHPGFAGAYHLPETVNRRGTGLFLEMRTDLGQNRTSPSRSIERVLPHGSSLSFPGTKRALSVPQEEGKHLFLEAYLLRALLAIAVPPALLQIP